MKRVFISIILGLLVIGSAMAKPKLEGSAKGYVFWNCGDGTIDLATGPKVYTLAESKTGVDPVAVGVMNETFLDEATRNDIEELTRKYTITATTVKGMTILFMVSSPEKPVIMAVYAGE